MEKLPQISEAEYEIMIILWTEYPLSTNEVCDRAQKSHNWNQKTIHTLLSRLTAKHVLSYEQRGRMYYYYPLISQKKYLEQENHLFLNRFYNGKIAPMLSSLLSDTKLTDTELKDLYDIINSKIKSGDS
ncbi:MAG TPA: BlaI/MecI/CopY family transcriptional regulator [Candidatus Blautia faecavium]|uniref:BlaI/MecI/CopY family transcriptional regulator n=1 Tax=Candidatus Blautia faecavium TaxID=2838487 RepID=A0A9D2LR33_9FIRM|nr:BlaI/MecI/CopY family transcriptional regulator [Candidatus Blautia faecavium]